MASPELDEAVLLQRLTEEESTTTEEEMTPPITVITPEHVEKESTASEEEMKPLTVIPKLIEEESTSSQEDMTPLTTVEPKPIEEGSTISEEEIIPPTTVIFEHIVSHECDTHIETHAHSSETFKHFTNTYNELNRQGKSRILPYLLGWMTKHERFYISIRRQESEYTEETNRIIDTFNIRSEYERRKIFPKMIAYFELLELDYSIIQDDKWKTPFIQKNTE